MKLILGLQLIPKTSFHFNLRNFLGKEWSNLSKEIRNKHNRTCQICGWKEHGNQYTHLHEVWEFYEKLIEQRLIGFECLCPTCHAVHHWGFSEIQGKNMEYLLNHACSVNKCSVEEFSQHIKESFLVWKQRSLKQWNIIH